MSLQGRRLDKVTLVLLLEFGIGLSSLSAQHGPHRKIRHRTGRLAKHALGSGPAQAVEETVRAIGRHHDQFGPERVRVGRITRPDCFKALANAASSAGSVAPTKVMSNRIRLAPASVSRSVSWA